MARDERLAGQEAGDKQAAAAAQIVELDPALVDPSFMADRMEGQEDSDRVLAESIKAQGQTSPILVRPHPTAAGRYQAAFGHRRLRAARQLGRPVRCIIRTLTDRELVIAQGQENSARADLSFMERARFALALAESGHKRPVIMQALCLDKTTLSRLIRVAGRLPSDIVEAVGPAPSTGRERWTALAKAYGKAALARPVDPLLESDAFRAAPSDQRFDMLYRHLTRPEPKQLASGPSWQPNSLPGPRRWVSRTGQTLATVMATDRNFVLNINQATAPGFGSYVLSRLEGLYEDYARTVAQKPPLRHFSNR